MANPVLIEAVNEFAERVVEAAQRNLGATRTVKGKKRRAVASGKLKADLTYKSTFRNNNPVITFTTKSAETKKYADVVEFGRRAGAKPPPIEPILKWIKIKPLKLRNSKGFVKQTEKSLRSAAFAISKSIGKKGIPPVNYYTDALNSEISKELPAFFTAIQKEIELRLNLK